MLREQFSLGFFSGPTQQGTNPGRYHKNRDKVPEMNEILATADGVTILLVGIKEDKATDPDGKPAKIIKICSYELAPVLPIIFQSSLS